MKRKKTVDFDSNSVYEADLLPNEHWNLNLPGTIGLIIGLLLTIFFSCSRF